MNDEEYSEYLQKLIAESLKKYPNWALMKPPTKPAIETMLEHLHNLEEWEKRS